MGKLTSRSPIVTADVDEDLLIHVVDTAGTPTSFKATLSQLYAVFPKNSSAGASDVDYVARWTAEDELGKGIIQDNGSLVTIGGTIKITGGSPSAGKFLQCDGAGLGSWADVTSGVQVSGTPVDNQIAVWTAADTIEGDANFTWDNGLNITSTEATAIDLIHSPSGASATIAGYKVVLTGNASSSQSYGVSSLVNTALNGSAYGALLRVGDSAGDAVGSYNQVSGGSVGSTSYGSINTVIFGGTETSVGNSYGSTNVITISTSGTHGPPMFGSSVDLNYNKVGGTLTNAFGFYSTGIVCNDSGATITNAYGIYLADNAGSGTITNSYGVYQDGADDENYFAGPIESNSQVYSSIASTVTPSALAATIDWNNGNMQVLDLQTGGSVNTLTLNNPKAGASYFIKIIQGGGNTITWPAAVKWAENDTYAGSVDAGDIDAVALTYDGTNYLANYSLDYQ